MSDRDLAATMQAPHGRGATLFKWVPVGARFVFDPENKDKPECILIRSKNGYRHEIGGRQWKTGARTACYVLP